MGTMAFVSEFGFGGAMTAPIDAVATHETPLAMRPRLRSMAALKYKPAVAGYVLNLSAITTAGAATLRLTDGISDLATVDMDLTAAQTLSSEINVELGAVQGQSALYWVLDITDAADAGVVADLRVRLEVEQPLSVSGC